MKEPIKTGNKLLNEGWRSFVANDELFFAREVNAMNITNKLDDNEMTRLVKRIPLDGYVNQKDVEWHTEALKKAGATDVRAELLFHYAINPANNIITLQPRYPMQFDIYYKGNVDRRKFRKLTSN